MKWAHGGEGLPQCPGPGEWLPDASSNAYSWFREESNLPRSPDRAAALNYADGGHILEHGVSSVLVTQPLSGENKAPIWGLVASR